MTATITSLDSHRASRAPTCGCARHRLEALTERAQREMARTEGQLVVDRQLVAHLVDDLVTTVAAALESNERTNP
jgi:hypothetical protein